MIVICSWRGGSVIKSPDYSSRALKCIGPRGILQLRKTTALNHRQKQDVVAHTRAEASRPLSL